MRVGWAVELPLVARSLRRLDHAMEAHHLVEDVALAIALLTACGAEAALLDVRGGEVVAGEDDFCELAHAGVEELDVFERGGDELLACGRSSWGG